MKTVSKEVKDKDKKVLATINIQQAETLAEAIQLAGSEAAVTEVFNRHWTVMEQNKHRPGRGEGTGAREVMSAVKMLSPEVQALLKNRPIEEIAALLEKASGQMKKHAAAAA